MKQSSQKGLTMIELLVVIGILAVCSVGATAVLAKSRARSVLSTEASRFADTLLETQHMAITAQQGKTWAISCSGSTWQRYGYTEEIPDPTPEIHTFDGRMHCTASAPEIRFHKLTGMPESPITFTLSLDGTAVISVSQVGTVTVTQ